jgi:hypothetical protein
MKLRRNRIDRKAKENGYPREKKKQTKHGRNQSGIKPREKTAKRNAIGTRINFETKNELKFSFNSQDSKYSKNLNGRSFTLMYSVFTWIETLINCPASSRTAVLTPSHARIRKLVAICLLITPSSPLELDTSSGSSPSSPQDETVKGLKLVREPRRDEQSVDSELGCVLLDCLPAMDGMTVQDEQDKLAVIVYSTPPRRPSTKSVTNRPA